MQFSIDVSTSAKITSLGVCGYKAAAERVDISLGNLTVLAGSNSSGKSTLMQPLLLLKQTLEAASDPGALQIDGPNVFFTSAKEQMFAWKASGAQTKTCEFSFGLDDESELTVQFSTVASGKVALKEMRFELPGMRPFTLRDGMSSEEVLRKLPSQFRRVLQKTKTSKSLTDETPQIEVRVRRLRCLLYVDFGLTSDPRFSFAISQGMIPPSAALASAITNCIHVPAFRTTLERARPWNEAGPSFPGEFDEYAGGILLAWQHNDPQKLIDLAADLSLLGLASEIVADPTSDVNIEILVNLFGSNKRGSKEPLVNIADVGFGVSQVLPVLLALRVATSDNLVYIEEPESHLHPRAQHALAGIIANAVKRGVRIVLETHSSLLLIGLQDAIARDQISVAETCLYWVQKNHGSMTATKAGIEQDGSYGSWPVDFDDVVSGAQNSYLEGALGHSVD